MSANALSGSPLKLLADYDNRRSLANRFRNSRFRFFEERLRTLGERRLSVLDVGGRQDFWVARGYAGHPRMEITLLNLQQEPTHYANLRSISGDACDMRRFADGEFEVAFSNSVIEHLGTLERQQAMAREVRRVGRHHFVQTPNRAFFFEPHFLIPWFQYLPRTIQNGLLTRTSFSRFGRISSGAAAALLDEIRLISETEFRMLFPQSRIYQERVLGMIKSFTAHDL